MLTDMGPGINPLRGEEGAALLRCDIPGHWDNNYDLKSAIEMFIIYINI